MSTVSSSPKTAVVLAGGQGTRLAPYTMAFPKPLVPLGEVPVLEIVLRQLSWHGVEKVIISVGYLAGLIEAYLQTRGGIDGLEISYLREARPLGTAGALGMMKDLEGADEPLLVVNGDLLTTFDFSSMFEFHTSRSPALTIAVKKKRVTLELGVLEVGPNLEVTDYREKPCTEHLCSMGIYLYSPDAINAIGFDERLDFPELVLRLLGQNKCVLAYETDCYWLDIGSRDEYERACTEFPEMRSRLLPDEASMAGPSQFPPQQDGRPAMDRKFP